jgi:hypothetical protein
MLEEWQLRKPAIRVISARSNAVTSEPFCNRRRAIKVHAARIRGISQRSLYRLIEKYHLE